MAEEKQLLDDKIANALKSLEEKTLKFNELDGLHKANWQTKTTLVVNGANVNLKTEKNLSKLKEVVIFLTKYKKDEEYASEILGVETNLKYEGFDIDKWIEDCKKAASKISYEQKKKELENLNIKLQSLLSEQKKKEIEFDKVMKDFDKL